MKRERGIDDERDWRIAGHLTQEQLIAGWKMVALSPEEAISLEQTRKGVEKLEFFIRATPESQEAIASLPVHHAAARYLAAIALERLVAEFFQSKHLEEAIQGVVNERLPRMAEAAVSRAIQAMGHEIDAAVMSAINAKIAATVGRLQISINLDVDR